ncbi:hypothetical protein [Arsukibacterium sp.]|uniref:hypothetical protein n=1 Tax=Arsukibacterium sp. TaxID=1977258 RepID=UPI00299DE9A2|nr:hypothetical protein [Arsukibacterium sp.]MDX1536381.1 hypothetical protein [Arsukibacterium sp.]
MNKIELEEVPLNTILISVATIVFITIGLYMAKWGIGFYESVEKWGQLGDFFGGILNPIIGLAGILLLAFTLRQNQIALRMTAEELAQSRVQLSYSADALQKQESHMKLESAERTVVYICNEIEKEYNYEDPPIQFGDRTISAGRSLLKTARSLFDGTLDWNADKPKTIMGRFSDKFGKSLVLLMMLAKATYNKDKDIKKHLYLVMACKLDMQFLCVAYSEIVKLGKQEKWVYTPEQLEFILELILEISKLTRFDLNDHRIVKHFTE